MPTLIDRIKELVFRVPPVSVRPPGTSTPTRGHVTSNRVAVAADDRPLWEIKHWKRDGDWLRGAYRLSHLRSFAGAIDVSNPNRPVFYITAPPLAVLEGPHAACFRKRNSDTYFIHFGISNPSIDSGLVAVEKLLAKSLNLR